MPSPLKKSFAAEQLRQRKKKPPTLLVVAVIIVLVVVGFLVYKQYFSEKIPIITQKPYVAVLPFNPLSEETEKWLHVYQGIID